MTADLLSEWLGTAGHTVVGPFGRLDAALRDLAEVGADAALVDISLAGRPDGLTLAEMLEAQRIPYCFTSGYSANLLPPGLRERPRLEKPFGREAVLAAVAGLLPGKRGA